MKKMLFIVQVLFLTQAVFGQQVQRFDKTNSDLVDDDLLSVTVDRQGNKWIGTSKHGLVKFDDKKFVNYNKGNSIIKGDYIGPVFTDSRGDVWISYSNPVKEIARFDGSDWVSYSREQIPIDDFSVIAITEDINGVLYFGGKGGIFTYNEGVWAALKLPQDNVIVRALAIDDDGVMAVGCNDRLMVYKENVWNTYTKENSDLILNTVCAVRFDADGRLYVGYGGGFGDGGFSIVDQGKWKHYNKANSKMSDHMVRDIEINAGVFYMATNNGLITKQGDKITPQFFREGRFVNVILDIAFEKDIAWVATNFGLIRIVN